jgi:hypothetical protein
VELERYWRAFSSDLHEVSGGLVLENRQLPILEVNAGYPNAAGQILEIKRFYRTRGRPACLILPKGSNLEREASNAQFVPHIGFAVLECETELEPNWTPLPVVEQVSWGAARTMAQTWCDRVGARDWEGRVSSEIARAMPKNPNMLAYVALEADQVIGMGFALDGSIHWLAGEPHSKIAIIKRGAFDSAGAVQFSVLVEQLPHCSTMQQLERYVVWTEVNPQSSRATSGPWSPFSPILITEHENNDLTVARHRHLR